MNRVNMNLIAKREGTLPTVLYFEMLSDAVSEDALMRPLLKLLNGQVFDVDAYSSWIREEFSHVGEQAGVEVLSYPMIYYDQAGFRAAYTLLLDANHEEAILWKWERRVFRGNAKDLSTWLNQAKG